MNAMSKHADVSTARCRHGRHQPPCRPASEDGSSTGSLAPYLYPPHDPLGLFVPRLSSRRCHRYAEVASILAGQPHGPVVYFARVGRNVKIGTSADLSARIRSFYLCLDDVLAVVPGDREVEALYHRRFRSYVVSDSRPELFRPGLLLRLYLARCRLTWPEAVACAGTGALLALATGLVAVGIAGGVVLGLAYLTRMGWSWR
jgi:hypothetical protein